MNTLSCYFRSPLDVRDVHSLRSALYVPHSFRSLGRARHHSSSFTYFPLPFCKHWACAIHEFQVSLGTGGEIHDFHDNHRAGRPWNGAGVNSRNRDIHCIQVGSGRGGKTRQHHDFPREVGRRGAFISRSARSTFRHSERLGTFNGNGRGASRLRSISYPARRRRSPSRKG